MSVLDFLTSLLAPDDCLGCGREGALLCRDCTSRLPPVAGRCFKCYQNVPGRVSCDSCLQSAALTALTVVASYQGTAKKLVLRLKFLHNQTAARCIAQALHSQIALPRSVLLTHMPATTAHIRERGFDQSALIVKHLARLSGCQRATLFARAGKQHQLGSDKHSRLTQLAASLRVINPTLVRGRHIIVVDDVLTTGSSLSMAAELLLAAGAASVDGLAFAQSIE